MKNLLITALLLVPTLFAGSDLILTGTSSGVLNDPAAASVNDDKTTSFQMTIVTLPTGVNQLVFALSGTGMDALVNHSGSVAIGPSSRDSVAGGVPCVFYPTVGVQYLYKVIRDHTTMKLSCEMKKNDGTGYQLQQLTITSLGVGFANSGGIGPNSSDATYNVRIGFIHVFNGVQALHSFGPTTADAGDLTELKFDGNGTDSTGHSHNAVSLANVTYGATANQGPQSDVRTFNAPTWSTWVSLHAGRTGQLDGSLSFSMADASSAVSHFWQQLSGPTSVTWSSRTAAQPQVAGTIFGTYVFQDTVTDAAGATASSTQSVGAVAVDWNCNLINADIRIDLLIGPSRAFGCEDFEFLDAMGKRTSDFWVNKLDAFGGTWTLEQDLTSLNSIPRNGAVYVTQGSATLNGIGTNFLAVFGCTAGTTPPNGPNGLPPYIVPHAPAGAGVPYIAAPRYVTNCVSDTQVTLNAGWSPATITSGNAVGWGTYGLCDINVCGNWIRTNNTTSNLPFYDMPLAHYQQYLRSGDTRPRDAARRIDDWWAHAPELAFQATPRDLNLVSQMLRATLDPAGAPANAWTTIRSWLSTCPTGPTGTNVTGTIQDPRENGYCLLYWAAAAMLDTGSNQTTALTALADSYTNLWSAQQQVDGSYINNYFEDHTGDRLSITNGSQAVHRISGPAFTSDFCNGAHIFTSAGTVSVGSDRHTLTGSGTNFVGSSGMVIELVGTRAGGTPVQMMTYISGTPTGTSLQLLDPWRFDYPVTITSYKIFNGMNSYANYEMFFGTLDIHSAADYIDTTNWYGCTFVDGDNLTLDIPYTGISGFSLIAAWNNLPGRGEEPFQAGIVALALYTAGDAETLAGNTALANNYYSLADAQALWIINHGLDYTAGGAFYGSYQYSNCIDITQSSFNCASNDFASERAFAAEVLAALRRYYDRHMTTPNKTLVDTLVAKLYAADGYSSPVAGDGIIANILDPNECAFSLTKCYGQAFSIGQAHGWTVSRNGGVAAPDLRTYTQTFTLPAGAVDVQLVVTAPSSASTTTTCTASPCSITVDARQGAHLVQRRYRNMSGTVLAVSDLEPLEIN